jgi:adenylate cyclase
MAFEIERKFLVNGDDWRRHVTAQSAIRQGYLAAGDRSSTRVRITDGRRATVTIKSKGAELRRLEVECAISVPDAEALLSLRQSRLIEKARHEVVWQGSTWEIDVFSGENAGLVIAEIELAHEHDHFARPPWLAAEVTGQPRYYNGSLARHPYLEWSMPAPRRMAAG